MATNKKSFILYTELVHVVRKLPKEDAGVLFCTILEFVNDTCPKIDNLIVELVFEPIKHQLKRDLIIWEKQITQRAISGKLGGIKSGEVRRIEAKGSTASKNEANEAVNVNVNVNVIKEEILENQINNTIEFIKLTENKLITSDQVKNFYSAFNISSAEKFYPSDHEKLKHFRNWLKFEVNRKKKDNIPELAKSKSVEEILAKYK